MTDFLALFPLSRALVPGAGLKLQLFEQRYLKLIRNCMESDQGFGIVGIKPGTGTEISTDSEFYQYGCYVRIQDWDQLDNGLLGISVYGEKRFSIENVEQQSDGLWLAEVNWLEDYRRVDIAPDYQGIKELCESLALHMGDSADLGEDAASLGWSIANMLPIGNDIFAQLLAEDDPLERLEIIAEQIDGLSVR